MSRTPTETFASSRNAEARREAARRRYFLGTCRHGRDRGNQVPLERSALGELHRRSSWVWEEDRAVLEAHPDALGVALDAIAQRRARVAVGESGELLGFSVVANGGREVCELDDLFVDSDVWRQGVGRALVEVAAARGAAAGSQRMTVVAHPRNFPFYESVGFVPGEPAQTRFGPAVRMWRELEGGDDWLDRAPARAEQRDHHVRPNSGARASSRTSSRCRPRNAATGAVKQSLRHWHRAEPLDR